MIHLVDKLFTHSLTQRITLTTGKVGKQPRQKHHLLLIDGHPIGISQITLHYRNVIDNLLAPMLTRDELGDIIHRTRTVKSIHRYKILERRRLQFTKIFLHTGRLKLECTERASLTVKLVGLRIIDRNCVHVNVDTARKFYILYGILDDRECL